MTEAFFRWANETALGAGIRNSLVWYPLVEAVHLIGLSLLLGSVAIQCARFFGLGMRRQSIREVAEDFAPWTLAALAIMAVSGSLLFLAKASDLYDYSRSTYMRKMAFVAAGVLFYYLVQWRAARAEGLSIWLGRGIATLGLLLWLGAALSGLSILLLE